MKKTLSILGTLLLLAWGSSSVQAATIELARNGDPLAPYWSLRSAGGIANTTLFNTTTGLGSITVDYSGANTYKSGLFVDHEIDQWELSNSFYNEYGIANGAPDAGQSWEIDEPDFVFGDIYANFLAGSLDNSNGVPAAAPEDVSMAMMWDFTLNAGETARVTYNIFEMTADTLLPAGFYLSQTDPINDATIIFTSDFSVRGGGGQVVPEPSTIALLGAGLAGLALFSRKRNRH